MSTGIVYCFSRKECEEVTFDLVRLGVKAGCYHADLTNQERTKTHMNWLKGSTNVSLYDSMNLYDHA